MTIPNVPRFNIPETFGRALSYEGQIHAILGWYDENAEYINDHKDDIENALDKLETLDQSIADADAATAAANQATTDANQATTDANAAAYLANAATSNANAAATGAQNAKVAANQAASRANDAASAIEGYPQVVADRLVYPGTASVTDFMMSDFAATESYGLSVEYGGGSVIIVDGTVTTAPATFALSSSNTIGFEVGGSYSVSLETDLDPTYMSFRVGAHRTGQTGFDTVVPSVTAADLPYEFTLPEGDYDTYLIFYTFTEVGETYDGSVSLVIRPVDTMDNHELTVRAAELQREIDDIVDVNVPDYSITNQKLSNGSVDARTVVDGSITRSKLAPDAHDGRPVMLAFISPSYGSSSYYPNDYALGVSYDGVNFAQVNGTEHIANKPARAFLGGNDVIITKIGDDYICMAMGPCSSADDVIEYVVTKDFIDYSDVKFFTAYDFAGYAIDTYGIDQATAISRVWEPNVFLDLLGNPYVTASVIYQADEAYPTDAYTDAVDIRYFKQCYAPVQYDPQTQTLTAASGGSISEFAFPANVDSVIDAQVIVNDDDTGYYYLYKDRKRLTTHVAAMSSLVSTPVNVVSNLIGSDYCENPYMVKDGNQKYIYVTHYTSYQFKRDDYVISTDKLGENLAYSTAPCRVVGDIMNPGTKCRSIHPVLISDPAIINKLVNDHGFFIPSTPVPARDYSATFSIISPLMVYYEIPMSLIPNATYTIDRDCSIKYDPRWFGFNGNVGFKRSSGDKKTLQITQRNISAYRTVELSKDGAISLYSLQANQDVLALADSVYKTVERYGIRFNFYNPIRYGGRRCSAKGNITTGVTVGTPVTLSNSIENLPDYLDDIAVVPLLDQTSGNGGIMVLDPSTGITFHAISGNFATGDHLIATGCI